MTECVHTKNEWCGEVPLSAAECLTLELLLAKIESGCHIPHSAVWCTASECPACVAGDLLKTKSWWSQESSE